MNEYILTKILETTTDIGQAIQVYKRFIGMFPVNDKTVIKFTSATSIRVPALGRTYILELKEWFWSIPLRGGFVRSGYIRCGYLDELDQLWVFNPDSPASVPTTEGGD